ncbi:pirin family protein [Pleomorphovibrio marinus]|uniref:pirin family protein n=1 Tax=Pleomorphovibrio marinus TaxID=2164132 RepID=UPI000E0C9051|nr:pirin family protein [Pleomorphovibrio marinus]
MKLVKEVRPLGFHWKTQDPFLFCAHHHDFFPEGNGDLAPKASLEGRAIGQDFGGKDGWSMYHGTKVPGFPYHPHKGFETVTLVERGLVDHSDSLGAAGRFGEGDVQWMTAGKGVLHSEMFPLLKEDEKNELLLFQIWLNLPSVKKKVPAHFKMMWKEDIPVHIHKDGQGLSTSIKLVCGSFEDSHGLEPAPDSWAADPANEVAIWHIHAQAGATFHLPKASEGVNRTLFFYEGESVEVGQEVISEKHSLDLESTQEVKVINGKKPGKFLFLQGRPIGEKVVQHGPFVMNSNLEIQQAVQEYQRTQFGGWPWPETEYTHAKEKGRFALHADGRKEEKGL